MLCPHGLRLTTLDALFIINELAAREQDNLASNQSPPVTNTRKTHYWDVTANSSVSPLDALRVINQLAIVAGKAEAELHDGKSAANEFVVIDRVFDLLAEDDEDSHSIGPASVPMLF